MSEFIVIANLQAKPGRADDLLALLSELATEVLRTEPELQRYAFYVEPGSDPLRVTVIEKYPAKSVQDAHNNGVLVDYLPRLLELVESEMPLVELQPAPLNVSVGAADAARLSI